MKRNAGNGNEGDTVPAVLKGCHVQTARNVTCLTKVDQLGLPYVHARDDPMFYITWVLVYRYEVLMKSR